MKKMAILVLKMIAKRIKSETPEFFKWIRVISIVLAGVSSLLIYINTTTDIYIPESLINISEYLVAFSISMGFTSQLTSVDSKEIDEEVKK